VAPELTTIACEPPASTFVILTESIVTVAGSMLKFARAPAVWLMTVKKAPLPLTVRSLPMTIGRPVIWIGTPFNRLEK